MQFRIIEWDQGWNFIQEGIMNLKKRIAKGSSENQASSTEIVDMYTTVYNMCTQKPPYEYTEPLYDRYQRTFEEHITSTVLPSLKAKHEEFLLQEFVKSWGDYKVMLRWMSRSFAYLDRYFLDRRSLPGLKEAAVNYYRDLVYREVNAKVREAAIRLIDKEREGGEIDSALLKNVIDIFVEIGAGRRDAYEKDFEGYMLTNTRDYYSRKASRWILEDNYTNYMLKAEECLRRERDIVSHYLHPSSEKMLVETVKHWLLVVYANQLIGKKRSESGCGGDCLTVDNIEELSKKFIAAVVLEQQVPAQCSTLFEQAEDAAMQE
ncbi:cullin-1 [Prunus yedoensis var. nudiflora]|uniref:Cullin-1 n=1 Tax=Prunus yedoensis var. nudiflora TaxID=2094558 RepID=A0A314ZHW7_PRUYE|nr:cullin-1 [Prunus yedoensis var. nudiflora]